MFIATNPSSNPSESSIRFSESYIDDYTELSFPNDDIEQDIEPFYLFAESLIDKETLIGKLVIKGVHTPERKFKVSKTPTSVKFSSIPKKDLPKIFFEVTYDQTSKTFIPKAFKIELAKNTLDAGILYTRYILALAVLLNCDLAFRSGSYNIKLIPLPPQIKDLLKERARIYRKLLFLQEYFLVKYKHIPPTIPPNEVQYIDYAFRAVIEGNFSLHTRDFGHPNNIDINKIPINKPGVLFIKDKKEAKVSVLGKHLKLGEFSIYFKKAILHPEHKEALSNGNKLRNLTFIALNQKIDFNFYRYSTRNKESLRSTKVLNDLKSALSTLEPEEIVSLLEEPSRIDVSPEEASKIVMDWLLFETSTPNCLFPGNATLNPEDNTWRVEIGVGLLGEKVRSIVGEAFVDKTTGRIVDDSAILIWVHPFS